VCDGYIAQLRDVAERWEENCEERSVKNPLGIRVDPKCRLQYGRTNGAILLLSLTNKH
jgi:hypothetical protein